MSLVIAGQERSRLFRTAKNALRTLSLDTLGEGGVSYTPPAGVAATIGPIVIHYERTSSVRRTGAAVLSLRLQRWLAKQGPQPVQAGAWRGTLVMLLWQTVAWLLCTRALCTTAEHGIGELSGAAMHA